MTLLEIATFVGSKVGQSDALSLILCKEFVNRRYRMIYDSQDWVDAMDTGVITATAFLPIVALPANIERTSKVKLYANGGEVLEPVDTQFIMEMQPELLSVGAEFGPPKFYREFTNSTPVPPTRNLFLYPTPDVDTTLLVYGKRVFVELTDSVAPIIRSIENCLIAFAQADMLQRQRQYAKAAALVEEAGALLKQVTELETARSNRQRANRNVTLNGDSLSEMTDAICARCGVWTTDYRVLIKDLLRREYLDLYDADLWPETTIIAQVDRDGSEIVLPEYFDRVVGVRQNVGLSALVPAETQLLYGLNPQIFEQSGSPVSFTTLTSVGVATLPPQNEELQFVCSDDADNAPVIVRGETQGVEVYEVVTLRGETPTFSQFPYDTPITIAKPITRGSVTITGKISGAYLQTLYATDREVRHMRLWLQPSPQDSDGTKALVLGKRKCNPLLTDEDTPILRNISNILINRVAAYVFAKMGNKDMATLTTEKASTAMADFVSKETKQNSFQQTVVPDAEPLGLSFYY